MKIEALLENFDLFCSGVDGVSKLRDFVIELSVKGKLVEHNSSDSPGCDLLASTADERKKLEKSKTIKLRPVPRGEHSDIPYKIPKHWAWARLSDVGYELGQKTPEKTFTYIDVGSIDPKLGKISDRVEQLEGKNAPSRARKMVAEGTVIYSTVRPYLRNIAIVEKPYNPEPIASTAFGILHPFSGINNRYLFYWLRSKQFNAYVVECMKGVAYPAINDEKFYAGYIPVPPTEEQNRIVAKVDELMALCDRLEAQLKERDATGEKLLEALVAELTES
jgi:type I restriction enzyme S subunit